MILKHKPPLSNKQNSHKDKWKGEKEKKLQ